MTIKPLRRSFLGLNIANFLQAEMIGVIIPVMNVFLRGVGWRYDTIGVATAAAGLGTLAFQAFAGWLIDRWKWRRTVFAAASIITGICFVAIPLVTPTTAWIDVILFLTGALQSFFGPLLGALALGLAGHRLLNRTIAVNQSWNHAGNIAAALLAMALISQFGLRSIFYSVGACSLFAAASMLLIRKQDLDERVATGLNRDQARQVQWTELFRDRKIVSLCLAIFAFHLANAPILPTVALYVKQLGGSDNLMTATVLTAQVVMVPVALAAGRLCDSWGRKPTMAVAFIALPLRIISYLLVSSPSAVVWLQGLDGIGAGIYGVAVVAIAADLTRGKGNFNALTGLLASAVAAGGVLGPLASGILVQEFGFRTTFYSFAFLAATGAVIFLLSVPETKTSICSEIDTSNVSTSANQGEIYDARVT